MSGIMLNIAGGSFGVPPGQNCFCNNATTTFTWVAPAGVTKVSVLLVGMGGYGFCALHQDVVCACGCYGYNIGGGGGGGGALGYENNYSVTPGASYKIKFTSSSPFSTNTVFATAGCATIFSVRNGRGSAPVIGGAGGASGCSVGVGTSYSGGNGGTGTQNFGGYGCYTCTRAAGGGSSAGYQGAGKNGGNSDVTGTAGCNSPGSGSGGTTCGRGGGGGGGIGRFGSSVGSSNGAAGSANGGGGGGANCGSAGGSSTTVNGSAGGAFGAGGGGGGVRTTGSQVGSRGAPANALIRIIWPGCARSFPSTRTGNE